MAGLTFTIIDVRDAEELVKWPMNKCVSLLSLNGMILAEFCRPLSLMTVKHLIRVSRLLLISEASFCLLLPIPVRFDRSLPAKSTIQRVDMFFDFVIEASSSVEYPLNESTEISSD